MSTLNNIHSSESESSGPTDLKVIGLGLGRTGTLSLCLALEILGFGPCHHPICLGIETDYWGRFAKATKAGDVSPEILNNLYRGFVSALDNTTALLAEQLYKAYPNAKFILTVRDPTKWAQSMKKTILKSIADHADRESRIASGTATEDRIQNDKVNKLGIMEWLELYHKKYHQNRLEIDAEGEFLRHNQRIIKLVPPEKLLIFDVAERWEPLTDFLGVPEPNQPFSNVNDSNDFNKRTAKWSKCWLLNGRR